MSDSGRSVRKEVTVSLIVTATLIGMLLVATATVLIYYRRQTRRIPAQPRRDARPTGYRTGLNADKLKKQASATLKGSDVMKEPVNWSNSGPPPPCSEIPTHRRSRSFDSAAIIDIEEFEAAALPAASVAAPPPDVALTMTSSNCHQHQQQQTHHRSRPQQRQLRRCNSWSLSESRRRGTTE